MTTRTTPIVSTEYNRMLTSATCYPVPIAAPQPTPTPTPVQAPASETAVEVVYERLRQISLSKTTAKEPEKKIEDEQPLQAPVQRQPAPARIQQQPAPALPPRAQPAAVNQPAPDPATAIASFWTLVSGFGWRNRSDGDADPAVVGFAIDELSDAQKRDVATAYPILFKRLKKALDDRHFFDTRPAVIVEEFVSHFIAMGEDMYKSAISTDDFTEFIADAAEYQDFHTAIKNSLRDVAAAATS